MELPDETAEDTVGGCSNRHDHPPASKTKGREDSLDEETSEDDLDDGKLLCWYCWHYRYEHDMCESTDSSNGEGSNQDGEYKKDSPILFSTSRGGLQQRARKLMQRQNH